MRARTTLGIIAMMVLANTVLGVDILVSALLAALLVLLARCVHVSDLRRSVDLRLIVVIACSFALGAALDKTGVAAVAARSEEHTSELQSLMRISYAVFCLKKKKHHKKHD